MGNNKKETQYYDVIDKLNDAIEYSGVTKTVVNELVGIEYITCCKYLDKSRGISDPSIAKRMVVVTNILNKMVEAELLPLEEGINMRLRKSVILERVDNFIKNK